MGLCPDVCALVCNLLVCNLFHVMRFCHGNTSSGNLRFASNQLIGSIPPQLAARFPANSGAWSSNCIVNASTSYLGCTLAERAALLDFYASTGGGSWVASSAGWMTSAHPCTWSGVRCQSGSSTTGPVV